MATVLELRIIGNIGRDATVKEVKEGVYAISFSVAHNKVWRDHKTGQKKTNTTWVYCTIWKRDGDSMRIVDFLKAGTLVEMIGFPSTKAIQTSENELKSELRLKVTSANILKPPSSSDTTDNESNPYDHDDEDFE